MAHILRWQLLSRLELPGIVREAGGCADCPGGCDLPHPVWRIDYSRAARLSMPEAHSFKNNSWLSYPGGRWKGLDLGPVGFEPTTKGFT